MTYTPDPAAVADAFAPDPRAVKMFWSKVDKDGPVPEHCPELGQCWVWMGYLSHGYGTFRTGGRSWRAHRFAYALTVGLIPTELVSDHLCRNKACVRPTHIEPVTQRENVFRGDSPVAEQALATHCPSGHPYSGENLMLNDKGQRRCRECNQEHNRRWWNGNRLSDGIEVDPAAIEALARAICPQFDTLSSTRQMWAKNTALLGIVALVTEGHMHAVTDCPWAERFKDGWAAMRQAVAEGPEARLAEAVALLRRTPVSMPAWQEWIADVQAFLAAHGGPDGECQRCGGAGCEACDARFLEGGPDAE